MKIRNEAKEVVKGGSKELVRRTGAALSERDAAEFIVMGGVDVMNDIDSKREGEPVERAEVNLVKP